MFIPTRLPDSEYVLTRLAVEKIKGMDAQTVVYVNMSGSYITRARILDGMAGKKCDLVENTTIAFAAYACQTDAREKTDAEKKQEFTAQMASFKLLGSDDVLASGNESQVISIQTVRLSRQDEDVAADISELVMRAIENEILKVTNREVHLFISGVDGIPNFGRRLASMMDLYGDKLRVTGSMSFCSPIDLGYENLLSAPNTLVLECPNPEVTNCLLDQLDRVYGTSIFEKLKALSGRFKSWLRVAAFG